MHNEIYADGIGEITVSGTTVRVDLVSLSPTERDQSNAPRPVFRQRIVMSVEGFANSVELLQKALRGLIEGGAIKRTPPVGADQDESRGAPSDVSPTSVDAKQNGSPNFN
ncbi:hypothetical protein [Mesorhizobium loti]|uniref:hypothetical protein n=1 Tax=Rhizobium loti TaxID=381 RepID=UPI00041259E5|nr:hypothetical protein [Mesorhizobium loti]